MTQDDKFIEVLSEIVKKLMIQPDEADIYEVEKKIVESLIEKGYEINEISNILENIFKVVNVEYEKDIKMRVLHPVEIENLQEDAKHFLFKLKKDKLISSKEFETILNELILKAHEITIDDLKLILNKKEVLKSKFLN